MAATVWKGTISFGLVNISVKLHSAVREERINFRMLDAEGNCPVKYERVCSRDGRKVPYLVPDRGGEMPYALLCEAMRETGTLGIGTITLRQKQYLAGIKMVGKALVLDLMRFASEVIPEDEFRFPGDEGLRPQEVQMAKQLIASLTEEFQPEKYTDEYQVNLKKIIAAKLKGKAPAKRKTTAGRRKSA